jgi:SAM-dependent methyltransferase
MPNDICPICENELTVGRQSWHFLCKNCYYEKSDLQQKINLHCLRHEVAENAREAGLLELRKRNFKIIIEKVKSLKPNGGRILDVGCAHGWFLEAVGSDFEVFGLEPDKNVFEETVYRNLPIRLGFFPQALDADEKFDVIVFNDVVEHIPDIQHTLALCYQHLEKGGLLVLNLPSSNGVLYRLSKLFCKLGVPGIFERFWQTEFPSPHLHYFNLSNLTSFLEKNKFEMKIKGRLSAVRLGGLYTRISYTRGLGIVIHALIYFGVAVLLPVLRLLPSDIVYVVANKN